MSIKITSPHRFKERILLFGGGGVGKTNAALSIAAHMTEGRMFVVDADYSLAYERALDTDFAEVSDRVEVLSVSPEWPDFIEAVVQTISEADPETDWLVIDPVSASWDWVQEWSLEAQYGQDLPSTMVSLRKEFGVDQRGYAAALANFLNWPLVKKEYGRLWRAIQGWKGHLILTAEAKSLGGQEDDETKMLFGPLGLKPAGESRMKHVTSTVLLLDHPRSGQWRMTTIKDRNRAEQDKEEVQNFAVDYLMGVGGWERVRKGKKNTNEGDSNG